MNFASSDFPTCFLSNYLSHCLAQCDERQAPLFFMIRGIFRGRVTASGPGHESLWRPLPSPSAAKAKAWDPWEMRIRLCPKYITTSWGCLYPYKDLVKNCLSERFLRAKRTYRALQLAEQALTRLWCACSCHWEGDQWHCYWSLIRKVYKKPLSHSLTPLNIFAHICTGPWTP